MKSVIISYSLTGNNEDLANSVAEELGIEHIKIKEPKRRTMGSIVLDIMTNRSPRVLPEPDTLNKVDLILFFGPIWMGHVATPFRTYFKHLKKNPCNYAYISISGGADGDNPKIEDELKKRVGKEPVALIDQHIVDLLPSDPKPVRKDTSSYRINNEDIKKLTNKIVKILS